MNVLKTFFLLYEPGETFWKSSITTEDIKNFWKLLEIIVQSLNHVQLFVTPWTATSQASLFFIIYQSLLRLMSIESVMPSNHLILLPSYPPALSLSQYQGLFQWVDSSHQVAKILELQLQHQSFQWIFRVDFLEDWLVWSPCSPRDSQEPSSAPQFKSI